MTYLGRGFCGSLTTSLHEEQMGFYVGSQHFQMKNEGAAFSPHSVHKPGELPNPLEKQICTFTVSLLKQDSLGVETEILSQETQHQVLCSSVFFSPEPLMLVTHSPATKGRENKILCELCSQTTVLWAVSFFLTLYPLWAARGNSWMIHGTGNSFPGVSFHAQGMVRVSQARRC